MKVMQQPNYLAHAPHVRPKPRAGTAAALRSAGLTYSRPSAPPVHALRDVTLDVAEGEFLSIVGPTGCGKSSLLRLVAGLLEPSVGVVEVEGDTPTRARQRRRISMAFQQDALLEWRTVRENIRLPWEIAGNGNDRTIELLELVGLSGFADRYPFELSGGMRQRAAIARALNASPTVLLMDEPFQALDELTRGRLNVELQRVWLESRVSVMFVTHSITEAIYLGDRVCVLSPRPGSPKAFINVPFPRPRSAELRHSSEFIDIAKEVLALLESQ